MTTLLMFAVAAFSPGSNGLGLRSGASVQDADQQLGGFLLEGLGYNELGSGSGSGLGTGSGTGSGTWSGSGSGSGTGSGTGLGSGSGSGLRLWLWLWLGEESNVQRDRPQNGMAEANLDVPFHCDASFSIPQSIEM